MREIRTPSEWIPPAYETVTVVTKDGQRIRGVKKNEDVFSIQIMDTRERIQGYLKSNLQDVVYEKTSLMPAFRPGRLNDSDLNDLIGYLGTLRGADVYGDQFARRGTMRALLMIVVLASVALAAQTRRAASHVAGSARRPEGSDALADLRRRLQRPAAQPAHADHAGERRPARPRSGRSRPARSAASRRRRSSLDGVLYVTGSAQQRVGDRRAHGPPDLALPPRAAGRPARLLRRS